MMNTRSFLKPLAIVMGRNYTSRLTMVRAAGMVGCDVILIQTSGKKGISQRIDRKSKYVVECKYCPEPDQDALIEMILTYKKVRDYVFLLPTDDYVAATIDRNLDKLKNDFLMPHVNHTQGEMLKIMDKCYQKTLAREVGMNVANGWLCEYSDGVYVIPEGISYPCFTKPQESYSGHLKKFQKKCNTKQELQEMLNRIARLSTVKKNHKAILVEEYIEIEKEYGVQGLSLENHVIVPAIVCKDSSREGLTATGHIYPISRIPNLKAQLTDFLNKTKLTGVFDIDLYESGGKFYFNELNTRSGAGSFALTYSVSNLPGLFIKYLMGNSDGTYTGPVFFSEKSFASEKVLVDLYYDRKITLNEYKRIIEKADILSIKSSDDPKPYREFSKLLLILPFWRIIKKARNKL